MNLYVLLLSIVKRCKEGVVPIEKHRYLTEPNRINVIFRLVLACLHGLNWQDWKVINLLRPWRNQNGLRFSLTQGFSPHLFPSCLSDSSILLKIAFISSSGWNKRARYPPPPYLKKVLIIRSISYTISGISFSVRAPLKTRTLWLSAFLTDRHTPVLLLIAVCILCDL